MLRHKKTILIIDDNDIFCQSVSDLFSSEMTDVLTANTGRDGMRICSETKIDVVILDQKLPDAEGISLCPSILRQNEQAKIIFVTAYPSFTNAIEAIKVGAHDYLSKPFELAELELTVKQALRTQDLEKTEQLQNYQSTRDTEEFELVAGHGIFDDIIRMIDLAADTDAPVLITGETGTGKNVVARAIHLKSALPAKLFLIANCAAFPETLIESELFGTEKGAFTGSSSSRKGIFELAEGGTLVLDEIGSMPIHLQSKLLGVLEEKKIRRIGSETVKPVNVRIIAAANNDLEEAVSNKTFRSDLYYRLSVIRLHIPPLRDRREDIPKLCEYFIRKMSRDPQSKLSDTELEKLMEYSWPGNVRELKNVIERSLIIQRHQPLRPSLLLRNGLMPASACCATGQDDGEIIPLNIVEKRCIDQALRKCSGNFSQSAKALGISLSTLKRKVKSYQLQSRSV
ncbi:MAG: sigma-54 dependent transcriptional regulator [Smithellaceae bacterium]|nr:sigma-54-dependent Fis family transcriptional regulator [Syntrophaceae bacterium]MDD4241894.1 sigma-54 dependent transcriptional regulator [Smithellaceae bacterium]NLX51524.1 sigma-54-dependent Fis family transcriptional regulator [Deltaproteobacteria bacterium]